MMPLAKLVNHPDFTTSAMGVVLAICGMTTKQLEKINISEVK